MRTMGGQVERGGGEGERTKGLRGVIHPGGVLLSYHHRQLMAEN